MIHSGGIFGESEMAEWLDLIHEALNRLPLDDRRLYQLNFELDHSAEECAELLRISVSTFFFRKRTMLAKVRRFCDKQLR